MASYRKYHLTQWSIPLQKPIERTILPFATSQTNEVFNDDLEKAAVFCNAELNRQKGGGFLRKQEAEKLIFTSKVLYPFWMTAFRDSTFLIDGLNTSSHAITYQNLPDLKAFLETLKKQQMTRQVHTEFLSNNQNYFQISSDQQKLTIEGLINDPEFTEEFSEYTKKATTTDLPVTEAVIVTPALDEKGVFNMLQTVENTRLKLTEELSDLKEAIKLLNSKSLESQTDLSKEIKAVENEYAVKIQKAKAIMDSKVSKINKAYSEEVTDVSSKFEQKLTGLHKDVVKFEKEKEHLDAEIDHAESEIKTSAVNKDEIAEKKWKEKRNELKDQRPEVVSKLKELQKQIDEEQEAEKTNLFQIKQNNEAKIKEAGIDLAEVEASRDAEIKVYQNEIEKIEKLTSNIIAKANELAKNREQIMLEFDQLGSKQKRTEHMLVYVPFYLSCYQSKSTKRYTYLPPAEVREDGLSTRLKALGKTKITQLFQPKEKKITSILNSFVRLMDENIVFSHEISEACTKANILQTEKTKEIVRNGLNKLKEQGWLSEKEVEEFTQALTH
jgi:hypothetical protein